MISFKKQTFRNALLGLTPKHLRLGKPSSTMKLRRNNTTAPAPCVRVDIKHTTTPAPCRNVAPAENQTAALRLIWGYPEINYVIEPR